jgi:acyl-coenzyme A synthetase/AMP-(fatty) acid ligase
MTSTPSTSSSSREQQYRELANTIAQQATALAEGTATAPRKAVVALLRSNVETLAAWTADDRSGALHVYYPPLGAATCKRCGLSERKGNHYR